MERKYEFTGEVKYGLNRIRALRDIPAFGVKAGDLGGWIEKESNLYHNGNARVYGSAWVYGNAWVSGNAWVYGDARVYGDAYIGWFKGVGSERGTLTWFLNKDGGVSVNRGCFNGTLDEFRAAVRARHGDSRFGQEYNLLIQVIEMRAAAAKEAV